MTPWITAKQALAALGIKPQSLYANVSRGRIRVKADPRDSRRSLYHRQDVERLARRRAGRQSQLSVSTETIRWGAPVLSSAITAVIDQTPYYRGRNALTLAGHATFEQTCGYLWQTENVRFEAADTAAPDSPGGGPRQALLALAELAGRTPPSIGRSERVLIEEAMLLIDRTVNALTGQLPTGPTGVQTDAIHVRLANAWSQPRAAQSIRCALVLLADHELNASTFAARVAASTGAPLAACLLAGLTTLLGPRHGGASNAMQLLVQNARKRGAAAAARDWLNSGQPLPAFGHPLYADGDPRARALLGTFSLPTVFADLQAQGEAFTGELPNIDFALTALADAYQLPTDAPFRIFATARLSGWTAHSLEQIRTGELIRPRAQYIGIRPAVMPSGRLTP